VGINRVAAAVVCFGAMVLLLFGCGSGDGSSATGDGLTKAEFASRADAICTRAKDEIIENNSVRIRKAAGDPQAREALEYKLVKTAVIPALEDEVAQLKALGAPAGDDGQIEKMLKLIEGAIDEAKTEPETYVGGDHYRAGSEHFGDAHRLAVAYGIKNCPMAE
jgi:hypothetical protein